MGPAEERLVSVTIKSNQPLFVSDDVIWDTLVLIHVRLRRTFLPTQALSLIIACFYLLIEMRGDGPGDNDVKEIVGKGEMCKRCL